MLVEFTQDTITGLKAGQIKDLPEGLVNRLISEGKAKLVDVSEVLPEVKPKKSKKNEKNN